MKTRYEPSGPVTDPHRLTLLANLESFWDAHALEGGSFRGDRDRDWWMGLIEQIRTRQDTAPLLFEFLRRDVDRAVIRAESPQEWSAWQAIRAMVHVTVNEWNGHKDVPHDGDED